MSSFTHEIRLLLVDDDPIATQLLSEILAQYPHQQFATSGEQALAMALDSPPDLILLDAEMPGMSGFQVIESLKAESSLADIPVIFVTSHGEAEVEVAGFEVGAADFIAKPVKAPVVLARVKSQLRAKRMADALRRIAGIDGLTGVANRRRFDESLHAEWLRARRPGHPTSLLLVDVDYFKLYNDRYGHPAGDDCLQSVAGALDSATWRPADLVARYGGEEFALLLPQTPRSGAEHIAHRVLDAIEALDIPHAASPTSTHVTVSVGVACFDSNSEGWVEASSDSRFAGEMELECTPADLVQAADKALYIAKNAGRAQAKLLDVSHIDAPHLARDIEASTRKPWNAARK